MDRFRHFEPPGAPCCDQKVTNHGEVEFDIVAGQKGQQADAVNCLKHTDHGTA